MKVLYSMNVGGNVHDVVSMINQRLPELAEYVLQINYFSGSHSIVVFRAPDELLAELRKQGRIH